MTTVLSYITIIAFPFLLGYILGRVNRKDRNDYTFGYNNCNESIKKKIKARMDAYSKGYATNDDARYEALELLLKEDVELDRY